MNMAVEREKKATTLDSVLLDLRERILLHSFDTSCPITESELSKMYQISRSSIRMALQTLESEGLVIITKTWSEVCEGCG